MIQWLAPVIELLGSSTFDEREAWSFPFPGNISSVPLLVELGACRVRCKIRLHGGGDIGAAQWPLSRIMWRKFIDWIIYWSIFIDLWLQGTWLLIVEKYRIMWWMENNTYVAAIQVNSCHKSLCLFRVFPEGLLQARSIDRITIPITAYTLMGAGEDRW